jgi:hypothetical protein
MNDKLTCNKYLVVRNFIPENRALDLGVEFGDHCRNENIPGDTQAPNSSSVYNYISFLELLCEKTPEISKIVGETVLPTYTYARVYRTNDELLRHKDRPSCELSLTVNLGGSEPWDIWVESEGKEIPITLNPGDAVVYLGAEIEHWREKFRGDHYYQVFLHYVLSRGQYAQHCFDRKQGEEISYYSEKYNVDFPSREIVFPSKEKSSVVVESTDDTPLETTDESPLVVTDDDVIETTDESPLVVGDGDVIETTDESPLVVGDDTPTEIVDAPTKDSFVVTNLTQRRDKPSNKLEDYIHIFESVLSDDLCDQIVSTFNDDSLLGPSVIRDNTINDHRTCTSCQISVPNENIPEDKRLYLDGELLKSINEVTRMYIEIHPWVHVETDTGYTFLKYAEGQHYTQHTDSFKDEQRSISCSFLLNDDFKGGEFCLFDRDLKLKPKKGSVIMFPSSFMYPHEILPVTENARYSIITWLV